MLALHTATESCQHLMSYSPFIEPKPLCSNHVHFVDRVDVKGKEVRHYESAASTQCCILDENVRHIRLSNRLSITTTATNESPAGASVPVIRYAPTKANQPIPW